MHFFKTHSSPRKSVLIVICTFIPLFLLAFWGLKIAVITWLYFEAVLLLTFVFCLFLVSRTHWEIEFQDNNINLVNTGNHHSYRIEALSQSDLIIRQTEKQKRKALLSRRELKWKSEWKNRSTGIPVIWKLPTLPFGFMM